MMDNEKIENIENVTIEETVEDIYAVDSATNEEESVVVTDGETITETINIDGEELAKESEQPVSPVRRFFSVFTTVALITLTVIMAIAVILNTFVFFKVRVSGPSMQPTLYTGNRLVANKYGKIKHGAIIIIKDEKPDSQDWLIKRVIGVGGDVVEFENGYVKVNGELIDEPYVKEQGVTKHTQNRIEVPEGEIFYLGDNRIESADSRTFGTCTVEQVVGVVENWSMLFKNWFNR